jgi:hypothetical protein
MILGNEKNLPDAVWFIQAYFLNKNETFFSLESFI